MARPHLAPGRVGRARRRRRRWSGSRWRSSLSYSHAYVAARGRVEHRVLLGAEVLGRGLEVPGASADPFGPVDPPRVVNQLRSALPLFGVERPLVAGPVLRLRI